MGSSDLREERSGRILSADVVAGGQKQVVPLAIVDLRAATQVIVEDLDRNFSQSLSPKTAIDRLKAKLGAHSEQPFDFAEIPLLPSG